MASLEMAVQLPSLGKPYPENPELAGDIVLKMIGGLQEKRIFGSTGRVDLLDSVLEDCIVSPKVPIDLLTDQDKHFLLVKLRIHSYGPNYHVTGVNPESGKEEEFQISLDDVPIKQLTEEFVDPIEAILPITKKKVEVKILRTGDRKKVRQRVKRLSKEMNVPAGEQEYITRVAACLVTVDGEKLQGAQKEKFIQDLPGGDIAFIKHLSNKYKYGFSDTITVTSPVTGDEYEAPVAMTGEFFRPRFD